eukprot:gnl/TRDRNA2_/TRDRNA2_147156_c0_seq1.p1 gnl/TRDRNA2_/TRDRNA2_147156_c0~~gnl/TRDRNA2_/TRDRNA2_147156_c0_seq1.p1  ORF type:complete len:353 (+),score=42.05 gnl/TRDRNA2_/TRDRNA2_147156_c0_seq1:45-1103(+)
MVDHDGIAPVAIVDVTIRSLGSEHFVLEVPVNNTVRDVKMLIRERCGTYAHMELVLNNSILDNATMIQVLETPIELQLVLRPFNEDAGPALYQAAKEGNTQAVKRALADVANPNYVNGSQETTPLQMAAIHGHTEVVRVLRDNGAEMTKMVSQEGTTACVTLGRNGRRWYRGKTNLEDQAELRLFIAAQHGQLELMRILHQAGIKMDHALEDGCTPIFVAARHGQLEVVQYLLDLQVEVDRPLANGKTPFIAAAEQGHSEVCHLLLAHGASYDCAAKFECEAFVTQLIMESGCADQPRMLQRPSEWVREIRSLSPQPEIQETPMPSTNPKKQNHFSRTVRVRHRLRKKTSAP